jgi:hypothetical protein
VESAPRMAIVNYTEMDLSDPGRLADYARADMIVTVATGLWCSSRNDGKLAELKVLNPDIEVIGYVNAHSSWLFWGDAPDRESSGNTYGWDWYHATRPYWATTTTGDTMMSWPGKALLNILEPDCRAAMIGVLQDHWYAHENVLDGVFWDHFNMLLWVPDNLVGVEGEMDLDGDGIPHKDDEDEKEAYRQASVSLIREFRAALGDDVIQITNGNRAARDPEFAGLVDGMMYENFPAVGFGSGGMRTALDPETSNNLFNARTWPRTANGGPWLILSNKYVSNFVNSDSELVSYKQAEFSRVAGAIADCLVTYHPANQMLYDWPEVDLSLGRPIGDPVFGDDFVSREFENGSVRAEFTASNSLFPFDFEIVEDNEVAQAFQYPSHYP